MTISLWNERLLAGLAITWGIILMLPGDLFAGIERYRLMSRVFPDWLWGAFYFMGGATLYILPLLPFPSLPYTLWLYKYIPREQLCGYISREGFHKHTHWLLFSLWLGMTALSLLSVVSPPTLLITSLVFVISMFHIGKFWRLGHRVSMSVHE